eukprot:6194016-Pleurochrysis_carterae.AAC.4
MKFNGGSARGRERWSKIEGGHMAEEPRAHSRAYIVRCARLLTPAASIHAREHASKRAAMLFTCEHKGLACTRVGCSLHLTDGMACLHKRARVHSMSTRHVTYHVTREIIVTRNGLK